jgi:hypothetical protein
MDTFTLSLFTVLGFRAVLSLFVVLLILAVVLTAALWFGTLFLQSYLYTEPSGGVFWQAPVAAGVLTFFYMCWSLLNVAGGTVVDGKPEIPYGIVWEFSNRTYLVNEPVSQFESKPKNDEPKLYRRDKAAGLNVYKQDGGVERWNARGVEWIKITHEGRDYKFVYEKPPEGANIIFVDKESGWEMKEVEMGRPSSSSFWRLVMYFLLNVTHLVVWIACLWLVLRFAPSHALGLGFVMWLLFTLAVLPGLFARAAGAV